MLYRGTYTFLILFCISLPAHAHPESFQIIIDVSVTILVQLVVFGVISLLFKRRSCNESLWLGLYGATLVFSILATTLSGVMYAMWLAPVVLYLLMIIACLKSAARMSAENSATRKSDTD